MDSEIENVTGTETENDDGIGAFTVLLISADKERCESYAAKAPEGVKIVSCAPDMVSVMWALSEYYPHAVFILFKKGERTSQKDFSGLLEYIESNLAYLGAMGSRIQLESFGRETGGCAFTPILTPRMLREEIIALCKRRRRHITALRKRDSDRINGKPPVIAAAYADMESAAYCVFPLTSYMNVNEKEYRMVYIDMRRGVEKYLRDNEIIPDMFIFADPTGETAQGVLSSIYSSVEYRSIPYIFIGSGITPKKKPAVTLDMEESVNAIGAATENLLKKVKKARK